MLKGMAFSPVRVMRVEEESPYKPDPVLLTRDHHPSRSVIAYRFKQPTRWLERVALKCQQSGLAPGGVYLAIYVAVNAGGLLHHRFILTVIANGGLFSVALIPRITPDGR